MKVVGHLDEARRGSVSTAVRTEQQMHALEVRLTPLYEQNRDIQQLFNGLKEQLTQQNQRIEELIREKNRQLTQIVTLEERVKRIADLELQLTQAFREKQIVEEKLAAATVRMQELSGQVQTISSLFVSEKELAWMRQAITVHDLGQAGINMATLPAGGFAGFAIGSLFGPVGGTIGCALGVWVGCAVRYMRSGLPPSPILIHYKNCLAMQQALTQQTL